MITTILIALFPVVQYLITGVIFGMALPIVCLLAVLVKSGIDAARSKPVNTKRQVSQGVILVTGILLVNILATMDTHRAQRGAAPVLAAAQAYKVDTNHYPANIADLVPKYLAHRPMAKYVAVNSGYFIHNGKLGYISEPTTLIEEFDLATGSGSYRTITQ